LLECIFLLAFCIAPPQAGGDVGGRSPTKSHGRDGAFPMAAGGRGCRRAQPDEIPRERHFIDTGMWQAAKRRRQIHAKL